MSLRRVSCPPLKGYAKMMVTMSNQGVRLFSERPSRVWAFVLMSWLVVCLAPAPSRAEPDARDLIKKGTVEVGLQVGYSRAFTALGNAYSSNRKAIYVLPQLGYVFTDELQASYFSGAFEIMVEPVGAHYFEPFSASLFGGSLVLRYNLTSFGRWVPYWDAGAGVSWTDLAPRIPEQSTQFEFLLETGPGVKYLWLEGEKTVGAFNMGVRLHHISNSGLGDRNTGINAILGLIGISLYFPD